MKFSVWVVLGLLGLSGVASSVKAQAPLTPYVEHEKRLRAAEMVGALKSDLFGDSISLYNGATEFAVTDIDVPGNNGLPVQLRRRFKIEARKEVEPLGGFGAWDIDVPYLYGIFDGAYIWNESANGAVGRCSQNFLPKTLDGFAQDIFSGIQMHLPGAGDREVLHLFSQPDHPLPTNGNTYVRGTRDFHRVRCAPNTANGYPGESFIAVDTSGTEYFFDIGFERGAGVMDLGPARRRGRVKVFLMASKVQDRHGNYVNYNYTGDKLTSITSSDGRSISIEYAGDNISRAVSHGREWRYSYVGGGGNSGLARSAPLAQVLLPDNTAFTYQYTSPSPWGGLNPNHFPSDAEPSTCAEPEFDPDNFTLTATHPSGAVGTFHFDYIRLHRSGTPRNSCAGSNGRYTLGTPDYYDLYSITSKSVTGPGLVPRQWTYDYGDLGPGRTTLPMPCTTCPSVKTVTVNQPDGSKQRHRFGILYGVNEGRLLGVDSVDSTGTVVRSERSEYVTDSEASTLPFPDQYGVTSAGVSDIVSLRIRPIKKTTIVQDGITYTSEVSMCNGVYCFDGFARPTQFNKFSVAGSKLDSTTYHDNTNLWVLSQVASQATNGIVSNRTDFDSATALPIRSYSFDRLLQTLSYYSNGTLHTVKDPRNHVTTLSGWKRGIPQLVQYPDATSQSVVVDDSGWIRSLTEENGFTTTYDYDLMGRLKEIVHPVGGQAWEKTSFTFEPEASSVYGIEAGHWKHTATTGNARKTTHYDALWQPVVEERFDASNRSTTLSQTVKRYDAEGRMVFQSYPLRTLAPSASHTTVTSGSRTSYDVLGRVISTQQDSELGPLTTSRNYSTDGTASYSVVTNARNSTTKTWYRAYDQPTEEMPIRISHPEGAFTEIVRDVFGAPQSIERRNESGSTSLTRRYYYDSNKQLCKVIEPETGPTAMSYDASGNLSWSASGLLLSGSFDCNADVTEIATRKVERTYDERNRLKSLSFPDGNGNQTWTYTKDGLPEQITTINDGVPAINLYQYNNRRLLTGESISGTGLLTWAIGYGYDNNGNLATHSYPGISVAYAPNALGQPTQAGTYATAVSYHPNGAMARFTYGNGIVHTMTQNARGLPDRSLDADGPAAVINDGYDYDFNGNVAAISDGVAGNRGNRTMTYDGLDRLVTASSPMFGPATYSYDVLDNLKGVKIAERDHVYIYDATNRLTNVTLAATGGSVIGLQYDEQGNLRNKNGQLYEFDFGNRLRRTVGKETYRYDGLGRRVLATHESQGNIFSMYGQDGVLRYQRDERSGKAHSYVTLNGSLVARVVDAFAPGVPTVSAPGYSTTGAYTVQWSAVPATTQYQLEESANSGAWQASYSGASTSTSISGKPSGSFAYRARACNPTACSGWSAVTSVAVQLPPSAVPTVSVPDTAANGSYTVSWTATAGATSYNLQEQVDAGAWTAIYSGAAQSSAFSAKPAGSYAYRVAACNPAGCSGVSAAATTQVVYPPVSPPVPSAPPQSLTGAFSVTWTAVAGATSYQLDESANGGAWGNIYSGGATSRALSSIAAGHYGYRVRACNVAGCSGLSGTVAVQVIHPPGTGPVLSAPATSTVSSYALSWTAVPAAEHYRLFELPPPWNAWVEIQNNASTSAVVSGKPTGFYYYVVRGCNAAGCGPDSGTPLVAVTLAPQSSPVVSAPATSPTGSYTVSWTTVPEATSYTFAYRRQGAAWTENSVGSQTSRSLTDAPAGVYEHMAKACNAVGCGPYSAVATVTSTAPVPPPPPTGLTRVQVNRLLCRISWNASPGATRYELFSNDSLDYVGPRTSTIHDARCPVGSLRVRACNEAICSGFGS